MRQRLCRVRCLVWSYRVHRVPDRKSHSTSFAEGDKVYYLKEGNPSANALGTGFLNNHNISLSGGTDKVRFRLSGNYSTEDGPMLLIRTGISAR